MLRGGKVIGFDDIVGNYRKGKRVGKWGKLKFFKDE